MKRQQVSENTPLITSSVPLTHLSLPLTANDVSVSVDDAGQESDGDADGQAMDKTQDKPKVGGALFTPTLTYP